LDLFTYTAAPNSRNEGTEGRKTSSERGKQGRKAGRKEGNGEGRKEKTRKVGRERKKRERKGWEGKGGRERFKSLPFLVTPVPFPFDFILMHPQRLFRLVFLCT
jgi:hypothetical protein